LSPKIKWGLAPVAPKDAPPLFFWPQNTVARLKIKMFSLSQVHIPSAKTGQTYKVLPGLLSQNEKYIGVGVLIDKTYQPHMNVPGMEPTYVSDKEAHVFVYYI
jgi:hypothetical protein